MRDEHQAGLGAEGEAVESGAPRRFVRLQTGIVLVVGRSPKGNDAQGEAEQSSPREAL